VTKESPRSRVVVFRLTEVEYASLKKACSRTRRTLSGFARSELLSCLKRGDTVKDEALKRFEQQLSLLQTSLEDLKELILCTLPEARNASTGGRRSK
jgi:hypothetical protein